MCSKRVNFRPENTISVSHFFVVVGGGEEGGCREDGKYTNISFCNYRFLFVR